MARQRVRKSGAASVTSGRIPKIIHQIWNTRDVPEAWVPYVASWRKQHPQWQYRLWTHDEGRRLVETRFPGFLDVYQAFSYDIQRVDALRYMILVTHGGLYVDLDFECLRPIDDLLRARQVVVARDLRAHAARHGLRSMFCNGFMAAAPGHPFLFKAIDALTETRVRISLHQEVMASTGPIFLTRVLQACAEMEIHALDEQVLFPFANDSPEMTVLSARAPGHLALKERCLKQGSYCIHYWAQSWAKNLAGALNNPRPHQVPGYTFYPGLDSAGFDICNAGREIGALAAACDRDRRAVGFNTDGFLKACIRPGFRWTPRDNPNGNEGLYLKQGRRARVLSLWNYLRGSAHRRLSGRARDALVRIR